MSSELDAPVPGFGASEFGGVFQVSQETFESNPTMPRIVRRNFEEYKSTTFPDWVGEPEYRRHSRFSLRVERKDGLPLDGDDQAIAIAFDSGLYGLDDEVEVPDHLHIIPGITYLIAWYAVVPNRFIIQGEAA